MQVTFHGVDRQYYEYDGVFYTATFPALWAETHQKGTGPKDCENCKSFCFWNGVFIGYCWDCAGTYNFTRGFGFNDGVERPIHIIEKYYYYVKRDDQVRACDTYLYGISFDDIGDTEIEDSRLQIEKAFQKQTEKHFQNSTCECSKNKYCIYRENFSDETIDEDTYSQEEEINGYDDDYLSDDGLTYWGCTGGYGSNYNGGYDSY